MLICLSRHTKTIDSFSKVSSSESAVFEASLSYSCSVNVVVWTMWTGFNLIKKRHLRFVSDKQTTPEKQYLVYIVS